MFIVRRHFYLLLLIVLLLNGCADDQQTITTQNSNQPVRGGVYRRAFSDSYIVLDPVLIKDSNSHEVCRQIYDGLVEFDNQAKVVPALATSWKISDDKLTYTFTLRDDVRFHRTAGGQPSRNAGRILDAADVVFSFKRLLQPREDSQAAFFWVIKGARDFTEGKAPEITGLRQIGSHTVEFTLEKPFAPFVSLLAMINAGIVPREDAAGDLAALPVGSGPFRWVARASDTIILEANEEYFRGRPWLDRLEFPVITDENERFKAFLAGYLSHVEVPDSQYRNVKQNPKLSACLLESNLWGTNYLGMNIRLKPFDNPLVRKAFNYAIDRETIVKLVLNDRAKVANGVLPPGFPGHDDALEGYSYNLERARQYLTQAGYPEGKGFPAIELQYNRDPIHARTSEFVLANLRDIGINCTVKEVDFGEHLTNIENGSTAFFRMGWTVDYPDPDSLLYTLFHSSNIGVGYNFSGFNIPEVDAFLDKARFETEMNSRVELYRQAEKLIVEEAPWVFMYFYTIHVLYQPQVRGLVLSPMGESLMQYRQIWFTSATPGSDKKPGNK
ncbi:MAG TPA: ABC transporter substrate-binding protein [Candidatus Rifleibacterium sp.]|nr:ABC transporter substrate-binding protein [Candidatus Rifleibacterium sp.]HPT48200.1 ABC transporter substrate-binding protein [Candidatus Rifleibacterium sp.]